MIDNQHDTCGIGFLYVKLKNPDKFQIWTNDSSGIDNIALFPPFKGKSSFKFGVLKNGGEYLVLGMKKKQYGSFWFKVDSSYSTYSDSAQEPELKKDKSIEVMAQPNYSLLLPKSTKKDEIDKGYYDYRSHSLKQAKIELKFNKIDETLTDLEDLQKQYPDFVNEILLSSPSQK